MARSGPISSPPVGRQTTLLNREAFANLVADYGVKLVHYRALPCPVGLVDEHDPRKSHHRHHGCSNGYIFERAGECTCVFQGNGTSTQLLDTGILYGSTVQVTFPPTYDDTDEPVVVAVQDRIELADPQGYVTGQQRFKAAPTGVDALQFPAEKVQMLFDRNGERYTESDFNIHEGAINWKGTRRPAPGTICSVRYLYLPFWYVEKLLHEIRVAPTLDPSTYQRTIERFPYSAILARENVARTEESDPGDRLMQREIPMPDGTESEILA